MTHDYVRSSRKIFAFSILLILISISTLSLVAHGGIVEPAAATGPTITKPEQVQYPPSNTNWYKHFNVSHPDAVDRFEVVVDPAVDNVQYIDYSTDNGKTWTRMTDPTQNNLQGPSWGGTTSGYMHQFGTPYPKFVDVRVQYKDPKKPIKFSVDARAINSGGTGRWYSQDNGNTVLIDKEDPRLVALLYLLISLVCWRLTSSA